MHVEPSRKPIRAATQIAAEPSRRRRPRRLTVAIVVGSILLLGAAALCWLARHAGPLLRARVVETLSARFHSPVELDSLHLSLGRGLLAEGTGLRILYLAGPTKPDARPAGAAPMLTVRSFQFHTGLRALFAPTLRVVTIQVQGAELHIPPKEERSRLMPDDPARRGQPAEGILVDKLVFDDLRLVIETRAPGKAPLEFDIANLTLRNAGLQQPFDYDATVRNPKPLGDVHSTGHFGPWQKDNPRDTPIDGSYIFAHADLSTIKGIGGILSSNARFAGTLGKIAVDGTADTPDFHLAIGGHRLPLHTSFHAIVDGTTGDTALQPVDAVLAHSHLIATGSVTRKPGLPGHDVELDINVDRGRIEDFLTLGVRTLPPVLRGTLATRTHIAVPQGGGTVTRRMRLRGTFSIQQAVFGNPRLQQQIDDLSERARGWPEKARPGESPAVTSSMKGTFDLANEQVHVSQLFFEMPGTTVTVDGQYGMDGSALDFYGTVRTQATASEMVAGWKSLLLMPFDRLLKKHGAGLELPFKLDGTSADPKLTLDFGHKTPALPLPK